MRTALFYIIGIVVVLSDQVSKWAVLRTIPYTHPPTSVQVIPHVLSLTHTHNSGGAFSLFQARNEWFILVAVVAICALVFAYHRMKSDSLAVAAALALAFGGAIGNLIDRIRFHEVVDFFDVHVWPIFNVADSAISIGIVLLAWHFLLSKEHARQPAASTTPEPAAPGEESVA